MSEKGVHGIGLRGDQAAHDQLVDLIKRLNDEVKFWIPDEMMVMPSEQKDWERAVELAQEADDILRIEEVLKDEG